MSRHAKASRKNILTQQPPKPRYHHWEHNTPEILKSPKSGSTACSTLHNPNNHQISTIPGLSKIQSGVVRGLAKLAKFYARQQKSSCSDPKDISYSIDTQSTEMGDSESQSLEQGQNSLKVTPRLRKSPRFDPIAVSRAPGMDLEDYAHRLLGHSFFSDEVAITAFIYVLRALTTHKELGAEHLHKLVSGCLLLAHKYLTDSGYYTFEDLGDLFGVSAKEVETIEKEVFFEALEADLYVSQQDFSDIKQEVTSEGF